MELENGANERWIEFLASGLGAIGALVAVGGLVLILGSQPGGPAHSIWPLPGMVLIDWLKRELSRFLGGN